MLFSYRLSRVCTYLVIFFLSHILMACGGDNDVNEPTEPGTALIAAQLYEQQCLDCHGNARGEEVELGGALTLFECDACTSITALASKIETSMPVGAPQKCDANCANAIATYIFETFDGFGQTLSGAQLYQSLCVSCHGDSHKPATQGTALHANTCQSCDSLQNLEERITVTMPFGDASACIGTCASKIAQFVFDEFDLATDANPSAASNLGQPSAFIATLNSDGVKLQWQNFTQAPDEWVLHRWDIQTAQWYFIKTVAADQTQYTDAGSIGGQYRLYAVTDDIASLPA